MDVRTILLFQWHGIMISYCALVQIFWGRPAQRSLLRVHMKTLIQTNSFYEAQSWLGNLSGLMSRTVRYMRQTLRFSKRHQHGIITMYITTPKTSWCILFLLCLSPSSQSAQNMLRRQRSFESLYSLDGPCLDRGTLLPFITPAAPTPS